MPGVHVQLHVKEKEQNRELTEKIGDESTIAEATGWDGARIIDAIRLEVCFGGAEAQGIIHALVYQRVSENKDGSGTFCSGGGSNEYHRQDVHSKSQ